MDPGCCGRAQCWITKDFVTFEDKGPAEPLKNADDTVVVDEDLFLYMRYKWDRMERDICWQPAGKDKLLYGFPLSRGYGDPVLFPWEGKWYFVGTNDNLDDIGIYVREADHPKELFAEDITEHLILDVDEERGFIQTFWAPEFHVIGGELYLLFAVGPKVWGPQCHMMKLKKGGSIIDPNGWEEPIRVVKKDGTPLAMDEITLDMTHIRAGERDYVVWSYREKIGTPLDSGSMLYIATVDPACPWKLTSDPVL